MAGCGVVTALVPLLTSYEALSVVSGAFGLLIAANYSLTSIILVELIAIDRFTNAYGLLLLVQGVANLIGPPLGGRLSSGSHIAFLLLSTSAGLASDVSNYISTWISVYLY